MTPEQFQRVENLFHQAKDLPDRERRIFLESACDDQIVRDEVLRLLQHSRTPMKVRKAQDDAALIVGKLTEVVAEIGVGDSVGPYRLLELLGEGGMGLVYLAEQSAPIHRRVALKVIKLGMDTKQTLARFETEREALALMNHPNVARVLDAGATELGRPFFIMEYVDGVPITDYCDEHRLSTRDRLRLFIDVCQAVQHAHQKGLIHRDIKPSNVLVTVVDGVPTPKVIDFGVAKATQQRLTERTFFTEQGQLIGTPGYMSPEQADMTRADVDTRTDVYSLGILLYELLAGTTPFDAESLRQAGFAEIQRIIREVDPPKPSTRLSSLGDCLALVAQKRGTEPRTLARALRGDLDWIVMKSIDKDPFRRYATPNSVAEDIQRYLQHEPVAAGPPGTVYRLKKFARRNSGAVVAVSLLILALSSGVIGTTIMSLRATAKHLEAEAERQRAEQEADAAKAMMDYLVNVFRVANPNGSNSETITVRDILPIGVERSKTELANQPVVRSKLLYSISRVYFNLGIYGEALLLAEESFKSLEGEVDVHDPAFIETAINLSVMMLRLGRVEDADNINRQALSGLLITDRPSPKLNASALNNQGIIRYCQGKHADAEKAFREALTIERDILDKDDLETADTLSHLSIILARKGKFAEAQTQVDEALRIKRMRLGNVDPAVAKLMASKARILFEEGNLVGAESLFRESAGLLRGALGDGHPFLGEAYNDLAAVLEKLNRHSEAEEYSGKAEAILLKVFGPLNTATAAAMNNAATKAHNAGRYDEAIKLNERVLLSQRELLGDEHPDIALTLGNLANAYQEKRDYSIAQRLHLEALSIKKINRYHNPDSIGITLASLAYVSERQGLYENAERYAREAAVLFSDGPSADYLRAWNNGVLGATLVALHRFSDAERLLVDGFATLIGNPATKPTDRKEFFERIIRLYDEWNTAEPGKGYDAKAAEWRAILSQGPTIAATPPDAATAQQSAP